MYLSEKRNHTHKNSLNLKNTIELIKTHKMAYYFLLINMFIRLYNFSFMFWLHTL